MLSMASIFWYHLFVAILSLSTIIIIDSTRISSISKIETINSSYSLNRMNSRKNINSIPTTLAILIVNIVLYLDAVPIPLWPKHVTLSAIQPSYLMESPLFPLPYPNMLDLQTIFYSPPGSSIVIEFRHFNLENETSCSYDRLSLSEQVPIDKLFQNLLTINLRIFLIIPPSWWGEGKPRYFVGIWRTSSRPHTSPPDPLLSLFTFKLISQFKLRDFQLWYFSSFRMIDYFHLLLLLRTFHSNGVYRYVLESLYVLLL